VIIVPEVETDIPTLAVSGAWEAVFEPSARPALEAVLPRFLKPRRWFAGKARQVASVEIFEAIPIPATLPLDYVILIKVGYTEGGPDEYVLPLSFNSTEAAEGVMRKFPGAIVARLTCKEEEGILYEALAGKSLSVALLEAIVHRWRLGGVAGSILAMPTSAFARLRGSDNVPLEPSVMKAEQSNTSIVYGDRLILKIFRRLQHGINPDVEIGTFLTERTSFRHFPPVAGTLYYQQNDDEPVSLGVLQAFVPNQGDAWHYALHALGRYLGRLTADPAGLRARIGDSDQNKPAFQGQYLGDLLDKEAPAFARELTDGYLESAELLGRRTAEMHMALASDSRDPDFAPEPFTDAYQRSVCQSMHNLADKVFQLLRKRLDAVPEFAREQAERVLGLEQEIQNRFDSVLNSKVTALRTRIHGDFHLGQVLHAGNDFMIIDFEGEPGRSITERRIKVSPLRDVAGMVRSFHYAAYSSLIDRKAGGARRTENPDAFESWLRHWYVWSCSAFLKSYLRVAGQAAFVPRAREELEILLGTYLLDKAVYELDYELNNRPDWVRIPLQGILELTGPSS
jgi:maltose alpha-D-glucosyltransferase/alpha-amylase